MERRRRPSRSPRGPDGNPTGDWTEAQRQELDAGENIAGLDPVDPQVLTDALNGFTTREHWVGGNRYLLEADQMSATLSKHHPQYWGAGGTSLTRESSTGFRGSITPSEMMTMLDDIIRTGTRVPKPGGVQICKTIDVEESAADTVVGIVYDVWLDNATGGINHFTPLDPS